MSVGVNKFPLLSKGFCRQKQMSCPHKDFGKRRFLDCKSAGLRRFALRAWVSKILLAARLSARAMRSHSLKSSPPDFDPVVHADASRPSAGGSACASEASAWMPGIGERSDAVLRTAMPGHDEEKNGRTKKIRRRNADRRNCLILPCRRARPRLKREAHDCRRSTAVLNKSFDFRS